MKTLKDITSENDIHLLVNRFYDAVRQDDLLAPYFARTNWDNHLQIMYKFWNNIILYSGEYEGNPMAKHQHINDKNPLKEKHFIRWNLLFSQTVQQLFKGPNADNAIIRAQRISEIILSKL